MNVELLFYFILVPRTPRDYIGENTLTCKPVNNTLSNSQHQARNQRRESRKEKQPRQKVPYSS